MLNNAGEIRGSRIFGPVARELRAASSFPKNCSVIKLLQSNGASIVRIRFSSAVAPIHELVLW